MFSPSQNGSAPPTTARTSRRRPRSGDSIIAPKAKRQRSALTDATFIAPAAATEMEKVKSQKIAMIKHDISPDISSVGREIAVRGGKKPRSTDRGSKGDGSVELTKNDTYTVSKLPALPDRLRKDVIERQHGAIYFDSGYALTLTHTHAIVWPYAVNLQSPETFTFALPEPSRNGSDPLPIGSLVSSSASSSEPGLVVVIPTTGKITYWESISSAATLDLRLQRNGVDFTIQGFLHGESVIQILNAESAGFILGFSSGRLAYMSVRDGQGRPAISVQFLRTNGGPSNSGIFGSLRNALSISAWHGDIAAIRAARSDRVGERNIVSATSKGKLSFWNVQRGGHTSLNAEVESRESIVMAIKHTSPVLSDLLLETFELLDFTYPPKAAAASILNERDEGVHLLLLTSMTDRHNAHYFLIEVVLSNNKLAILSIRPIKSYQSPVSRTATAKPRLYLPNPALVAYVVFDQATVVVSMAKQPDSPESQLRTESHLLPLSFEDVVDFSKDVNVEIVGSGMEEPQGLTHNIEDSKSRRYKAKNPAVVIMVRGGGIIRVAATDITRLTSSRPQQITAKSKLEQAVFYGALKQNLLNFQVRTEQRFPDEEVGHAALELSLDILKSEVPHMSSATASVKQNLDKRSSYLHDLALYLKASGVKLDRITKWKLLWCAEKISAASAMWDSYDKTLTNKPVGGKRSILTEVVEFIHEEYKTEPVTEAGELDRVRHFFIKDIWNLEIAIPWVYQVIKYTYQDGGRGHDSISALLSEGNDMVLKALQNAFQFRTDNLELYGLEGEDLEQGVLVAGYEGLPEFWTSTYFTTENMRKQTELAGLLVKGYWKSAEGDGQGPSEDLVQKLRRELPELLDLAIRASRERIRWDSCQDDPTLQLEAERITGLLSDTEHVELQGLALDLDLMDEAADLAERHGLLTSLASTLQYDITRSSLIAADVDSSDEQRREAKLRYMKLKKRVHNCFDKFGTAFATALFELDIKQNQMADLLDEWPEQQQYLTTFLRSKPDYAKLSWINDITKEGDSHQAAKSLLDLGLHHEDDLWSKQVELSIGKLTLLANRSHSESGGLLIPDGGETELSEVHAQLDLIKIQDVIYDLLAHCITSAIDAKAELQLAMETVGNNRLTRRQPKLFSLLEESMTSLIRHQAMKAWSLIDLLTLMGGDNLTEELEILHSQRFYLALKAARSGLSDSKEQTLAQRIIWRRCMLRDDWVDINDTTIKDDLQVTEQLAATALYQTFTVCIKEKLFDNKSNIKPMGPDEVYGAGSEELDQRFSRFDSSTREQIMNDMLLEDTALRPFIEKCRLEQWYQSILAKAKDDCAIELHEQTDEGGMMKQAAEKLAEIEQSINEEELKKAENLLHSTRRFKPKATKANGSVINYRSSYRS